jgi:hypothetical protein
MTTKHDSLLASNLGFDARDLAENRAGRLSEKQAMALQAERQKNNNIIAGILLAMTAIFVPVTFAAFNDDGAGTALIVGAVYLGVAALFYTFMRSTTHAITADLNEGRVEAVQGPIQCYTSGERTNYNLRIGEVLFANVKQQVYVAFKHLDVYTLYYVPTSKHIVAAEHVSDGSNQ